MPIVLRATVLAAVTLLAACTSESPETATGALALDPVPLPTRAPAKPKPVAPREAATASVRPAAETPAAPAANPQAPANPGSLLAASAPADPVQTAAAPGSLFQTGATAALPGVAQPVAPGAVGGLELRGALPAVTATASADPNLPGVVPPPTGAAAEVAARNPAPPGARYGANPPSATALRGSWTLKTTASNVSCTIAVSPAEARSAGAVSAEKNCLAYGALNRFELRGRDLVLIDPFGETATLNQLGTYWQGRGRNGESVILQR